VGVGADADGELLLLPHPSRIKIAKGHRTVNDDTTRSPELR
jgi:hypothetical protein